MINSPCNPTGAVYSRDDLLGVVDCCRRHGWWLISDEIYRDIAYERPATSVLAVTTNLDQVVVVDGMAKGFAMPGWRIGWSISSIESARAIAALQSHTTSNAATISQHAALAALSDPDSERAAKTAMVASFRRRRDAALDLLRSAGIEVVEPQGAFYLFIRVGRATPDDSSPGATFARALLESDGVAVVPGAAFHAPEWIRVSFAASDAEVLEGVHRIVGRLSD